MALNIPMPMDFGESLLKGVDTGSNFFTRLMQPIIEREKQAQLERHFQEELKLRKAAAGRAGANSDLQRMMMQEQLLALKHKNDPNWELQNYLNTMKAFGGGGTSAPSMAAPQEEFGEGQGMFTPEGLQEAQAVPEQQASASPGTGFNTDVFKQNPLLRGFFKHKFGVDPLAVAPQTPEEKNAAQLDLFKQKEAIKAQNKGANTNAVKTKAQNIINGVPNALPIIDEIIASVEKGNVPGQLVGRYFSPDAQATYAGNISESAETLANSLGYPNTEGGFHQAEKVIARQAGESDNHYIERLKTLKKRLVKRRIAAQNTLNGTHSPISNDDDWASKSDEELQKIIRGEK
jgi:hypothetical protein